MLPCEILLSNHNDYQQENGQANCSLLTEGNNTQQEKKQKWQSHTVTQNNFTDQKNALYDFIYKKFKNSAVLALGRNRQKDQEFKANLSSMRHCLNPVPHQRVQEQDKWVNDEAVRHVYATDGNSHVRVSDREWGNFPSNKGLTLWCEWRWQGCTCLSHQARNQENGDAILRWGT